MNIGKLVQAGIGIVVGVVFLKVVDTVNNAYVQPNTTTVVYNNTLTGTVMTYMPTLFAVGILVGSVAWAILALKEQ